jgi:ribosomal protein S18 acetylase RimI-like enzyme
MGTMFVIERFEASDVLAVLRLAQRSLGEELPYTFFLQMSSLRPDYCKVARDPETGGVVGFIVGNKEPGLEGRVLAFAVDPRYQSLGVGRELLGALQREMMFHDVRQVRLEVRADNTRAIDFYQRHGFNVTKLEPRAYKDGVDAFHMMKPLR